MLTSRDYIKSLLLDISWFEAAALGGVKPMQMVAQCIANRARLGWGDWAQVLSQVYTPGPHALPRFRLMDRLIVRHLPDVSDPRFTQMLSAVDRIYDNTFEDLVKGGTYWADLQLGTFDRQFEQLIMKNSEAHPRTAQSGTFCIFA